MRPWVCVIWMLVCPPLTYGSHNVHPRGVHKMSIDDTSNPDEGVHTMSIDDTSKTGEDTDSTPRDVDSGCPCYGCLPGATFTLSSGVPVTPGKVKWSTTLETSVKDYKFTYKGCVSDQTSVVCPTKRGYTSLDPMTGKVNWNYTTAAEALLPMLDVYGDTIGSDVVYMYYIGNDGTPQHPINISLTENPYSLMMTNYSQIFFASKTNITNQLIAYGTDGVCIASIALEDTIDHVNGSFVVAAQPVISGARTYVLTEFLPNDMTLPNAKKVIGMQRLYAADVYNRMVNIITIAWHQDLHYMSDNVEKTDELENRLREMKKKNPFVFDNVARGSKDSSLKFSTKYQSDDAGPILVYSKGVVYINNVGPQASGQESMPTMSTLWAVHDNGPSASVLYRSPCNYGPMAVYDYTYSDLSDKEAEEDQVIWILTRSPGMVTGHSAKNGSVVSSMWISDIAKMPTGAWLSSVLSVTRQSAKSKEDILLMGVIDSNQEPSLLVVGAGSNVSNQKPRLIWVTKLAEKKDEDSTFTIDGQIVNYVDGVTDQTQIDDGAIGIYAVVVEHGMKTDTATVKAVF